MFKFIREFFANIGKLPPAIMSELQNEGIVLINEKLRGSITYKNFRAPGKYSGYRKVGFTSSIAVTKTRLYATAFAKPAINVPFTDERIRSINFSVENDKTLCAAFDASLFHSDWSGMIEYRFHVPEAQHFLDEIEKQIS